MSSDKTEILFVTLDQIKDSIRKCNITDLKAILVNSDLGEGRYHLITGDVLFPLASKVHEASNCNLAEFKEIMTYLFTNYDIRFSDDDLTGIKTLYSNLLLDILRESHSFPHEKSVSVQSVQRAVFKDNYILASYFLDIGRQVGQIDFEYLLNREDGIYDYGQYLTRFKWMLNNGGYLKDNFLEKVVCANEYYNEYHPRITKKVLSNVLEALLDSNLTTVNEIENIYSNCKIRKILDDGGYENYLCTTKGHGIDWSVCE